MRRILFLLWAMLMSTVFVCGASSYRTNATLSIQHALSTSSEVLDGLQQYGRVAGAEYDNWVRFSDKVQDAFAARNFLTLVSVHQPVCLAASASLSSEAERSRSVAYTLQDLQLVDINDFPWPVYLFIPLLVAIIFLNPFEHENENRKRNIAFNVCLFVYCISLFEFLFAKDNVLGPEIFTKEGVIWGTIFTILAAIIAFHQGSTYFKYYLYLTEGNFIIGILAFVIGFAMMIGFILFKSNEMWAFVVLFVLQFVQAVLLLLRRLKVDSVAVASWHTFLFVVVSLLSDIFFFYIIRMAIVLTIIAMCGAIVLLIVGVVAKFSSGSSGSSDESSHEMIDGSKVRQTDFAGNKYEDEHGQSWTRVEGTDSFTKDD